MEDNTETPNLKDTLRKISENLDTLTREKKVKKFQFPWGARVTRAYAKKGYAGVCYIDENKNVNFFRTPIDEGVLTDKKGIPHIATADHVLTYKNKPFLIVAAWDQYPFSPKDKLKEAIENNSLSVGWRLLANTLESEKVKPKMQFGGAIWWIIGIIVIAGAGYFMFKGGF